VGSQLLAEYWGERLAERIARRQRRLRYLWMLALVGAGIHVSAVPAERSADPAEPYLGRWDVTLQTSERAYSSWLDIQEVKGRLRVRMVGRWGHARWLPHAEIADGRISFISPKAEEGRADTDMIFEGRRSGEELVGQTSGPDGTVWTWRAERAPSLARARAPHWGEPIRLFDGKDMSGWMAGNTAAPAWRIADGTLVSPGHGADLQSTAVFGDFKLHIEFNCEPGANSGVYLRGRYEVQIEDDVEPEGPSQRTGAIYGYLAPVVAAPRTPGVWQTYDITLVGRRVTVVLNGKTLIDKQEIPGITGGALDSREASPGPIVLQGGDAGHVAYRNIIVTPDISAASAR